MKMEHSYLVGAIILLVIISGCAQANIALDSLNKMKALKESTGYSVNYNMDFKYDFSEKTKAGLAKNPSAGGGFGALGSLPTIKLKQSFSEKGKNVKSYLDISDLIALTQKEKKIPFQKVSTHLSGGNFASCLYSEAGAICTSDNIDELSKKSPEAAAQLKQYQQFSDMTPETVLSKFKTLYDKGAITLGATGKETVAGRECDKISYTILLSKLDPADLIALMGPSGGASSSQLAEAGQFLQTMIKSVSQDMCLDKQYGVVLSSTSSTSVDMTDIIKGVASSMGSKDGASSQVPDEFAFTITASLTATNFKPSAEDSEFLPPKDAKMLTSEEMEALLKKSLPSELSESPKPEAV